LDTKPEDVARQASIHYKEAMAGMPSIWKKRIADYFLDIADDGYTIASGPDAVQEEADEVMKSCHACEWYACPITNCLGECTATGCNCSRIRNPTCREAFLRTCVQRLQEVSKGKTEITYASLGSGLLRFDFTFLEYCLGAGLPITAVHVVDVNYDSDAQAHASHRVALAQFAAWFASRNVDVYAHASMEKFTFRARSASLLPMAVIQVDCSELTWVFEKQVKPMLEEVLHYGGLFCALTAREGASNVGTVGSSDAWGELWRLSPESGRVKLFMRLRYRPGYHEPVVLGEDEELPPAQGH